jgi:aspartate/methionine/tyrosine aminotransferase
MPRFPENDIISLVGLPRRYELGESTGPDLRLSELVDGGTIGDLPLAYGTAAGDPALRRVIAETHGADPEEVVVTVGGMHALFLLAFILCNRSDEAVIAAPCFPLARNALEAVGASIRVVQLSFDKGYRLDPRDLRGTLSPKTRLVSLASPQNPSGVAISAEAVRATLELMHEVCPDAYLLIDDTYREAAYGNDLIAPSALALGPKVISVASLSKCHGAPGLRLGWAISHDLELRRQLVVGKFNTVVSCSPLDEALALRVFERRAAIIADRRVRLDAGLQRTAFWVRANSEFVDWVQPDAGAICCVRLNPEVFDDDAVAHFYETVAEKDARVARGTWFGDEARVFRLGFGMLSMADLGDAFAALTAALRETAGAAGRR